MYAHAFFFFICRSLQSEFFYIEKNIYMFAVRMIWRYMYGSLFSLSRFCDTTKMTIFFILMMKRF